MSSPRFKYAGTYLIQIFKKNKAQQDWMDS